MLYNFLKPIAFLILKFIFRLKIEGGENLPPEGGVILASNHFSNLDPIVLGVSSFRRLNFLAKEELFKGRLGAWFLKKLGAFPLKREKTDFFALKESLQRLKKGEVLVIFPQGRRVSLKNSPVRSGVGFLAKTSGVKVVPVKISGTEKILPPGKVFPRLERIRVVFGRPMVFNLSRKDSVKEISQKIFLAIEAL